MSAKRGRVGCRPAGKKSRGKSAAECRCDVCAGRGRADGLDGQLWTPRLPSPAGAEAEQSRHPTAEALPGCPPRRRGELDHSRGGCCPNARTKAVVTIVGQRGGRGQGPLPQTWRRRGGRQPKPCPPQTRRRRSRPPRMMREAVSAEDDEAEGASATNMEAQGATAVDEEAVAASASRRRPSSSRPSARVVAGFASAQSSSQHGLSPPGSRGRLLARTRVARPAGPSPRRPSPPVSIACCRAPLPGAPRTGRADAC